MKTDKNFPRVAGVPEPADTGNICQQGFIKNTQYVVYEAFSVCREPGETLEWQGESGKGRWQEEINDASSIY